MCGEMGWCGGVCGGWDGAASVALAVRWGGLGCVDSPPQPPLQSPEKKIGGSIQLPWCPPFYLSTYPTKSNPDMRNSKLAHTQAGF